MADLVRRQLAPFAEVGGPGDRVTVDGPPLLLKVEAVQNIGLALHELATNAVKHGALSNSNGEVSVHWTVSKNNDETPCLRLTWVERGGPPVTPPQHKGFGNFVIERMVGTALAGTVALEFAAEGFSWTLIIPATYIHSGAARRLSVDDPGTS
jgi:two-component sensor histidine kinase